MLYVFTIYYRKGEGNENQMYFIKRPFDNNRMRDLQATQTETGTVADRTRIFGTQTRHEKLRIEKGKTLFHPVSGRPGRPFLPDPEHP
jgi:hypothetical protein